MKKYFATDSYDDTKFFDTLEEAKDCAVRMADSIYDDLRDTNDYDLYCSRLSEIFFGEVKGRFESESSSVEEYFIGNDEAIQRYLDNEMTRIVLPPEVKEM